jgi:uncharacterized protein (DUF58 family)
MPPNDFIGDVPAALRAAGNPHVLRNLQRLRIVARHRNGSRPGNTPMPHGAQPAGLELSSHKAYAPGDDLRYFDWNAYGRLEQMMVKTFRAEREAPLHVLIDVSASMGVPRGDGKLPFAAALATGLAYVSLRQHDPVRVFLLGDAPRPGPLSPLFRHPQRLPELQAFLSAVEPRGATALAEGIDSYLRTTRLPGTAVVLSDFLVADEVYQRALGMLSERGYGVAALRVVGPEELRPRSLPARVRLHDSETGAERIVDLDDAHRRRYEAAIDDHLMRLKRWCEGRSILFAALDTASGLEACLFEELPRIGLLR